MTISLLANSAKAVSTVASPTSIAPVYSSGTTAGNLLILAVTVTGTNPTITTPTNWTQLDYSNNSVLACGLFSYPNNPGGITTVTVTVSASTGGAVASCFEFSGIGPSYGLAFNTGKVVSGTGTALANCVTPFTDPLTIQDTLMMYLVGRQAATLTVSTDSIYAWSTSQQGGVSTGGTTNAQHDFYWTEQSNIGPTPTLAGTLGTSVSYTQIYQQLNTVNMNGNTIANIVGSNGVYVGRFFQGMIGG